jgi:hypothetical protein
VAKDAEGGKIEDDKLRRWACGCWRLEAEKLKAES